ALEDVAAATPDRVGPKAATLARLAGAGLPVPPGVCLTAEVYRRHLALGELEDSARRVAGAEGFEMRRLAAAIRLGPPPAPPRATVRGALGVFVARLLGDGAQLAVRSSALSENTAPASFAGQFETFLGVGDAGDLVTAVRACWASLWSARALRYARAYDLDP